MHRTLQVHFLPELTSEEALRGATVVMIDVLRASTTIVHALEAGARDVIPCLEVEEVRTRGGDFSRDEIVLGGERGGEKIDLFDLGNSPSEYTPETVGGKTVLFTTTNGTKALARCKEAHRVLIGGAVNLTAVCQAVRETMNVHLLCAGTDGEVTREDALVAGAMVYEISRDASSSNGDSPPELNDSALLAQVAWRGIKARAIGAGVPISEYLAEELRLSRGGRNLLRIGHEKDLLVAADVDRLSIVPEFDLSDGRIHLA